MRWFPVMLTCSLFLGDLSPIARGAQDPAPKEAQRHVSAKDSGSAQLCPFHPKAAHLRDRHDHRFVWRERCGNNSEDHQLGSGLEWEGDSREFLALGEAWVRGKRRRGLLMLSFPDENVLTAQWNVDIPKGRSLRLQYALTDWAVRHSSNGLKFTVTAEDEHGKAHTLLEDVLGKGDEAIRDRQLRFDDTMRTITFAHDNLGREMWDVLWIAPEGLTVPSIQPTSPAGSVVARAGSGLSSVDNHPDETQFAKLRLAIKDLAETFPERYRKGREFLARLELLEKEVAGQNPKKLAGLTAKFIALRREALVANPLVDGQPILFVVRHQYRSHYHAIDTLFHTGEFNPDRGRPHAELFQGGGALKTIDLGNGGQVTTLVDVPQGVARDPDVHFSGKRIVFAMRHDAGEDYHIYEVNTEDTALKQLTSAEGVCDFDPIYLADDHILFSSTREPKYNMCSRDSGANLFRMEPDGANIHQITKNTLFDNHAALLPDGRILYARWEYVDRNFGDAHGLWTVNPDGTNQAVYWGNNTTVPGAVFNAHAIPETQQIICVLGPHHDRLWGALGIIDRRRGIDGRPPVLRTWPASAADSIRTGGPFDCDNHARSVRVKYEDPWPLSDKYFLCSKMTGHGEQTAIYLVDVFGNEILLHAEGPGCYDPMPLAPRMRPPVVPHRRDFHGSEGTFFVADVYQGTYMEGVRRGSAKHLRVVESPEKRHWSPGRWNGQGYTAPGMNWHSLENKRILGTVPIEEDGSAHFAVPADTFVYFQLLDEDGQMIQSMRSGTVLQSGETTGCVGCHEHRLSAPPFRGNSAVFSGGPSSRSLSAEDGSRRTNRPRQVGGKTPLAFRRPPSRMNDWYGPPRLFGFASEVQPVFDKHCLRCHDYGKPAGDKLNLAGDPTLVFNVAYLELWRKGYLKCVGGGPAEIQPAYSWGSHASKLVQVLRDPKFPGHEELVLSKEELDRISTWADLNGVYYATYACAYPDSRTGRCPLDQKQLGRLSELTGVPFDRMMGHGANPGPLVNFRRTQLSPCLAKFKDTDDPAYKASLSIIEAGKAMLASHPRADMSGFVPCETDLSREQKYAARQQIERRNREAIRLGKRVYDD